MRGLLRTILLATAATAAAVALYLAFTLPPRALHLEGTIPANIALGAYHIHTARSDGTGTVDDVAAAAARAGLGFVVLTDHGDATRPPDAPAYRHGVLIIDAVEISTDQGHLVALGLAGPAPYPLAGDAAAVIADVHRLGGAAVIAHPDSPNPDLRWRGGLGAADGLEWLNADSEWRDEPLPHLIATAVRSLVREPEAIASLISRPERSLQRWDAALASRPMFAIAAVDAHARIGWGEAEPRGRSVIARPTYDALFRALVQGAELEAPLTRQDAAADAARVLHALTTGRSFSLVRAFAEPAHLEFTATRNDSVIPMGGQAAEATGPMTLRARVPEAPGARVALLRDGREVAHANGAVALGVDPAPGTYRVEVTLPGSRTPWLVSNAIRVGLPPAPPAGDPSPGELPEPTPLQPLVPDAPWAIEHDVTSTGSVTDDAGALAFAFHLGSGTPAGQYAALSASVRTLIGADRVAFTARADRPMRVSVQLRLPGGKDGQRWRQSVYVDDTPRVITVRLQDLAAVGITTTRRPFVAPIQGLLFVVDTVNTPPGSDGKLWISGIAIGGR